jgi:hypothetical protein
MSLASRVTNFFSGSTSARREGNDLGFADADDGLPGGKGSVADGRLAKGFRSENMAQKAAEEEGRPPYLHVR